MEYYALTDIGKQREKNEDSFYASDNLFIVADGMGGHLAGEVASRISVETFTDRFLGRIKGIDQAQSNTVKTPADTRHVPADTGKITSGFSKVLPNAIKSTLISSLKEANKEVFKKSVSTMEYYGMGTTFTGCFILDNKAHIIHVGDSRIYLKSKNGFNLLTKDHTIVGELFRKGEISYRDTFNHPQRNFLTNVLGVSEKIKPDYLTLKLSYGDLLILCSDGLNSMVWDQQIEYIIERSGNRKGTVKSIAGQLVKAALKNGGNDNITVIAVKV